jgi:hypothetical protein
MIKEGNERLLKWRKIMKDCKCDKCNCENCNCENCECCK